MAVSITTGLKNRRVALLGNREKVVGSPCRTNSIHSYLDIAVGGVFETHGAGQPRRQFPVGLALGGARPDCPPTHQISEILGGDQIQVFSACGQAQTVQVQQ